MKKVGIVFLVIGILSFIGAMIGGHSVFGPLFWLALGFVLIYLANEREAKNSKNKEEVIKSTQQQSNDVIEQTVKPEPVKPEPVKVKTYWEAFKENNYDKAKQAEALLGISFSELSDIDAREKIEMLERFGKSMKCSISELKELFFKQMEIYPDRLIPRMIETTKDEIVNEANKFHIKQDNTLSALMVDWLNERLHNSSVNASSRDSDMKNHEDEIDTPDVFREKYRQALNSKVGSNAGIPLFCDGYDSPVAQELMRVMYHYLKNEQFKDAAEKKGLWNTYMLIIVDETEKATDKYCDAALQECIEYYNFPERPVITRHRCPTCGSKDVMEDYDDFGRFECMNCGRTWNAPLGKNLYL